MPVHADITRIREDVAYIRAKIEVLPDHEDRLRRLERFKNAVPSVAVLGLIVSAISAGLVLFH